VKKSKAESASNSFEVVAREWGAKEDQVMPWQTITGDCWKRMFFHGWAVNL